MKIGTEIYVSDSFWRAGGPDPGEMLQEIFEAILDEHPGAVEDSESWDSYYCPPGKLSSVPGYLHVLTMDAPG